MVAGWRVRKLVFNPFGGLCFEINASKVGGEGLKTAIRFRASPSFQDPQKQLYSRVHRRVKVQASCAMEPTVLNLHWAGIGLWSLGKKGIEGPVSGVPKAVTSSKRGRGSHNRLLEYSWFKPSASLPGLKAAEEIPVKNGSEVTENLQPDSCSKPHGLMEGPSAGRSIKRSRFSLPSSTPS